MKLILKPADLILSVTDVGSKHKAQNLKLRIVLILSLFGNGALASGKTHSFFACSLPPFNFTVIEGKDRTDQIEISEGTTSFTSLDVERDYEGSGVCRYAIWRFEYNGKMSIKTHGCYGEVDVPEGSLGQVIIDEPEEQSKSFFCY